jgi:hypothetical protein
MDHIQLTGYRAGEREEMRHSLIGKIYGPESDECKELASETAKPRPSETAKPRSEEDWSPDIIPRKPLAEGDEEKFKEPFEIAYLLSSLTVLSFWVLVLMKGEFDTKLLGTGFFWEPHFLLLMAVLYHKTRKLVFGVLVFGVLIIEKAAMVYALGANGSFRGGPTIMLIAASFGLFQALRSKNYSLKRLLKIPSVILFASAFWSWASYDGYLSTMETFLPMLNLKGALGQAGNWLIVCIQGALGYFLWELAKDKETQ